MDGDSGRRLDMNHGFLKSIVKNQIDRDEYHKLMMERKEEVERRYAEREREKAIEKRNERFAAAAARATPSTPKPSSSGGGDSPGGGAQRVRAERADSKGTRTSLYVPPHLRRAAAGGGGVGAAASARASVRATAAARRSGGGAVADVCPPCFEALEVTELREKVRSRLRAEMGELELPAAASDDETRRGGPSKPLFMLNMTNAGGTLVEVAVMSTDSAARLAKTLGRKHGLNEEQCRMLRLTLEKELDARL